MGIRLRGGCVCRHLRYSLDLTSTDEARTTLCHCGSCRRASGTNFGLTAKVPIESFKYECGSPKRYRQENSFVGIEPSGCPRYKVN
ncbi:hypothetical protein B0H67DRAFT_486045 [Lasiosphaeris hirsuta]|uniref:CENP-V/GFA domain-containing protein n=1 Tax=Lasiosphaeris hirsuta TaxID=260670 RepID=A0AA40AQF4_9PEZI|nr:hypothetical protein B0H67DRAFT_486045 [Lasiosphaeris hirsuta]